MAQTVIIPMPGEAVELELPDVNHLVTEDDTPVGNLFSEKQQRLLVESLYSSWRGVGEGSKFLAAANIGLFYSVHEPAVVPDVFLSLDVQVPEDWYAKNKRSYFVWEFGKLPDVVVEIVSNKEGEEDERKWALYARIGVDYYVIFDPLRLLSVEVLRIYERHQRTYTRLDEGWLPGVQLGIRLWEGVYEDKHAQWLRWYDRAGQLIPTGAERIEQERLHAEQERQRAERLAAQLRALGVEPEA